MWTEQHLLEIDPRLGELLSRVRSRYSNLHVLVSDSLYEHGLTHIGRVVSNVLEICLQELVDSNTKVCVLAAALCHDIGYITHPEMHVKGSLEEIPLLLRQSGFATTEISTISSVISAHSSSGKKPENIPECILMVADKCDMLGYDGTLRQTLLLDFQFDNRDSLASYLLKEATVLHKNLKAIGVGAALVEQRWVETETFLRGCLSRRFDFGSKVNN